LGTVPTGVRTPGRPSRFEGLQGMGLSGEREKTLASAPHQTRSDSADTALRRLFEQANVGIADCRPDGRFITANPCYCTMVGRPRAELLEMRLEDVVHPDDRTSVAGVFERCIADGASDTLDSRYVALDGSTVRIRHHLSGIRDEEGLVQSVAVVAVGLTGRGTEAALAAQENFRRMFELSNDAIFVVDLQSQCIVQANPRAAVLLEYPPEVLVGLPVSVVHPNEMPQLQAFAGDVLQHGRAWTDELTCLTRTGRLVPAEISASPFVDPEGRTCMVAMVRDISDRKRAEEALRNSETYFRELAERMPHVVWTNLPDGRVDWVNSRWLEYTGQSRDQVTSSPDAWMAVLHPEDRAHASRVYREGTNSGEGFTMEARFRRVDGEFRWFLNRSVPLRDSAGRLLKFIGTCTDIDDVKRANAAADVARAEAEAASRLKDEFLAVLSHELRTPLNAVLGWAQILRECQLSGAPAEHALTVIERNARAQYRLVEDLLDMSRVVTGKLSFDMRIIDLSGVLDAALDGVRPAAANKDIELRAPSPGETLLVSGDPARLEQVIWNLLTNAVKFTAPGGRVDVKLRRVGGHAELVVADTGEGIAPDFLPHVFDRFRQADRGTTRRHGGLGVGLALVRAITAAHGGTVAASSPGTGGGATFVVRLPISSESVATTIPAGRVSRVRDVRDLRVLIVDDDPDARELLAAVLGGWGAVPATAASAEEAVALIRQQPPQLLLADIGMPGQDGLALIREIRAMPAESGGRIAAVSVTAYASLKERDEALRAGFDAHVTKPVDFEALLSVITDLRAEGR